MNSNNEIEKGNCKKCKFCKYIDAETSPAGVAMITNYECSNENSENHKNKMNSISSAHGNSDSRENSSCDQFSSKFPVKKIGVIGDHENKFYDLLNDSIYKMSNGLSNGVDAYLMSDIKRLAEAGILKIHPYQPDFKVKEDGSVTATVETRMYHSAEDTIKELEKNIEKISEAAITMTNEEIEKRDKQITELNDTLKELNEEVETREETVKELKTALKETLEAWNHGHHIEQVDFDRMEKLAE